MADAAICVTAAVLMIGKGALGVGFLQVGKVACFTRWPTVFYYATGGDKRMVYWGFRLDIKSIAHLTL